MNKQILFVCAGKDFPQGAFNFLLSMHHQEPVSVLGLFFKPIDYEAIASAAQLPVQGPYDRIVEKENEAITANKTLFAKQCAQHHIRYHIHEAEDQWNKQLLAKESRFADLLLLSGELFYADCHLSQPNPFLQEALHCIECPIMVVPESFTKCDHLFMAYDGSKDSVFAIRQFAWLFPQYTELPADVVYVKDESSEDIPDMPLLRRYTMLHFACMGFSKLHLKAARYFAAWIGEHSQVMLVTGAYGRSPFSYLTKRSFAEQVIHDHKIPVFIAHT
jgi:hypothetical protein